MFRFGKKEQIAELKVLSDDEFELQARALAAVLIDANNGFPELMKSNPELAQRILDRTHEVAECHRRAQSNPDLLDMRLD